MAAGRKTGGRVAGTPNKVTAAVRSNVLSVFDQIGGTENMATPAPETAPAPEPAPDNTATPPAPQL